jgi:hypothetical protein
MPEIPPGVIIEGDLMGKVVALKFSDHDITDAQKFPELAWDKYLRTKSVPGTGAILVEPQSWVVGLEKSGILNLLEIPHFGRSLEINACVKLLLSCIHGGNFMARSTSIYRYTTDCMDNGLADNRGGSDNNIHK